LPHEPTLRTPFNQATIARVQQRCDRIAPSTLLT
jgi:hypothetical protein